MVDTPDGNVFLNGLLKGCDLMHGAALRGARTLTLASEALGYWCTAPLPKNVQQPLLAQIRHFETRIKAKEGMARKRNVGPSLMSATICYTNVGPPAVPCGVSETKVPSC